MGRMSDLMIEIEERLASGQALAAIAQALGIPLEWVAQVENEMFGTYSDFARIYEDPGYDQT